jgi:hypothetical protein
MVEKVAYKLSLDSYTHTPSTSPRISQFLRSEVHLVVYFSLYLTIIESLLLRRLLAKLTPSLQVGTILKESEGSNPKD